MKQGEIYLVNLDPATGDEIKKKRPVVIVNGGDEKNLRLSIVVPVTNYKENWKKNPFFVTIEPNNKNSLIKKSSVDCYQIRAISYRRFISKIGKISQQEMDKIKKALTLILYIDEEHTKPDF